jgi:hypothetical protein
MSNVDRVNAVFATAGRPLTPAEIAELASIPLAQVRGVLQRRSHFSWVGKRRYAPAGWGLEPYAGAEKALLDALQVRNGSARAEELIADVVDRFGCTAAHANLLLYASPYFDRLAGQVTMTEQGRRAARK